MTGYFYQGLKHKNYYIHCPTTFHRFSYKKSKPHKSTIDMLYLIFLCFNYIGNSSILGFPNTSNFTYRIPYITLNNSIFTIYNLYRTKIVMSLKINKIKKRWLEIKNTAGDPSRSIRPSQQHRKPRSGISL